jgi:hypothetical protein
MSKNTTVVVPDAPASPNPATLTSLADYEAARPQLLKDSLPGPVERESADLVRARLLQEDETRAQARTRDERGRFAAKGDATTPDVPAATVPDSAPAATPAEAPATTRKNPQERIAHVVWEREEARRAAAVPDAAPAATPLRLGVSASWKTYVPASSRTPGSSTGPLNVMNVFSRTLGSCAATLNVRVTSIATTQAAAIDITRFMLLSSSLLSWRVECILCASVSTAVLK